MTACEYRRKRRLERRAAGIRALMEFPVPQPVTPLSRNVVAITFESWRAARAGEGDVATMKLFCTFGAFKVKPKRGSRGLIWNNQAFWWNTKGYYRAGKNRVRRRPLQHLVWEHHHGRKMPARHEIFFRDRNRHNFDPANLELLSKEQMHLRLFNLGECPQVSPEVRRGISQKRWTNHARNTVSGLLKLSPAESIITKIRRKI